MTIDIGSSYIKSALFDLDQASIVEKHQTHTPEKRAVANRRIFEIPVQEIYRQVKQIIDDYLSRHEKIEGVVFSTQMHGAVLEDPAEPEAVYISWQDTRSLDQLPEGEISYLDRLAELFPKEKMENTGVHIKPALALSNLYTYYRQRQLPMTPGTTLYTLGSYLISRLTGNNICHITNGAPLGMVDLTTGTWRQDILEQAGLQGLQLPRLTRSLDCCGSYGEGAYPLAVFPDIGDTQAAVLGCSAEAGDVVINIGTAGQILYLSEGFCPGPYEIRPFFENLQLKVISSMPSGRNLDVQVDYLREAGKRIFHQELQREEIWERILENLSLEETQGLQVDAGFYELPDRQAAGAIYNIDHANFKIDHVIVATLLDIGSLYDRYFRRLCAPGEFKGSCYFCGGAARKNPLLVEAIRRATGIRSIIPPSGDEVHRGMFRLALLCSNRCGSLEETRERRLRI